MKQPGQNLLPPNLLPAHLESRDWARALVAASGKPITPQNMQTQFHGDEGRRVYLVIDCSNSMSRRGKMPQARRGALRFAKEARNKRYLVGLISFDSTAFHILEPTEDFAGLREDLAWMRAGRGSTNMADAIRLAREHLTDKRGERVVCIVTDGQPDSEREALAEAEEAKRLGMEIMTIGTDDADKAFLEQLASRHELAAKVSSHELEQGILNMARMLPMLPAPRHMTPRLARH